jgi:hypothetical protein
MCEVLILAGTDLLEPRQPALLGPRSGTNLFSEEGTAARSESAGIAT